MYGKKRREEWESVKSQEQYLTVLRNVRCIQAFSPQEEVILVVLVVVLVASAIFACMRSKEAHSARVPPM